MKLIGSFCALLVILIPAVGADEGVHVSRGSVTAMEQGLDRQLSGMFPGDPLEVVGLTQGSYIEGYGAVFMSEVNLAPSAGISPFHPTISKEEVARIRQKKLDRVEKFKTAMQGMLVRSAASLDGVPAQQQVALSISMFYWPWENSSGLPAQIVMHAQKGLLVGALSGKTDPAALGSAVKVQVY